MTFSATDSSLDSLTVRMGKGKRKKQGTTVSLKKHKFNEKQVRNILCEFGFRVPPVRTFCYKNPSFLPSHKVSLYGQKNALLWYKLNL